VQKAKVSMQDLSPEAVQFWRGYNKALVDFAESIERRAKKQIKERRAGATAFDEESETPGAPPGG
jgi:hypothetical protein